MPARRRPRRADGGAYAGCRTQQPSHRPPAQGAGAAPVPLTRMSQYLWAQLPAPARRAAFRALEWLSDLRRPAPAVSGGASVSKRPDGRRSLWVFVSTIGELNAIEPFLRRLLAAMGRPPLTLISDRLTYGDAYRAKFPDASVRILDGRCRDADALARHEPPALLLVAEIPCTLHDAPCRFSFATVHAARRAGAPSVLVNGWLYGYTPPSRMDRIEKTLFARDYLHAFDLMTVQTDAVRAALIAQGAEAERVVVTGNIKFDAMLPDAATMPTGGLVEALGARGEGPVIVAGSVTETADQRAVLDAFVAVRRVQPHALLVLAPRHPENLERMQALLQLLDAAGLPYRRRSGYDANAAVQGPVLILDTMGELRGVYAACTWAFVGTDHNVLEPLAFGKPVFVGPGWEPTYPSYPVYSQLLDAGALRAVGHMDELATAWSRFVADHDGRAGDPGEDLHRLLQKARGAVQRNLAAMAASPRLAPLLGSTGAGAETPP